VTQAGQAGPGPDAARAMASAAQAHAAVAAAFREEAGHLTASLVRSLGDFDLAEESLQEAVVQALEHWPREGIPRRPGAWLLTVARRRALNRLSRDARYAAKLAELAREPVPELASGPAPELASEPDNRLQLVFTCCHPALRREWQVALTLRAVFGFTTGEIARAFVASEDAVAQRVVRAKRKIASAGIPYRMPGAEELPGRLLEVPAVLYLVFNEGHLATSGSGWRRDLSQDALWLTGLLCRLLPGEPEALGLAALMRLHLARASARFTETGVLVRLADQDRSLWDHDAIAEAATLIERAAAMHRPGPYQVEAAIAACHAEAPSFESTDWMQVVALYDLLLQMEPSPVIRLNRALAIWRVAGAQAALRELDRLAAELDGYHIYHAARGELLSQMGRNEQARAARLQAHDLTHNQAERALLRQQLLL
jgi:predicted RNA polymerase sigma factor